MPRSRVVNRVVSIDSSSRSPEIFQSTDESCHLSIEIPCSFACRAVGSSIESPQSIRRVGLQKFSSRLVGPVIEELFDLIADCWRHEIIPDGMSVGVQILLWKRKKAPEDRTGYRPITIGPHEMKLLDGVFLRRRRSTQEATATAPRQGALEHDSPYLW